MGTCISSKDYEENEETKQQDEKKQQEEKVKTQEMAGMVYGKNIADIARERCENLGEYLYAYLSEMQTNKRQMETEVQVRTYSDLHKENVKEDIGQSQEKLSSFETNQSVCEGASASEGVCSDTRSPLVSSLGTCCGTWCGSWTVPL